MKNIEFRKQLTRIPNALAAMCSKCIFLPFRIKHENLHYQSLYPDFNVQSKSNTAQRCDKNVIYLTFDDCPSPLTRKFLAVLERENIKATFFVTGMPANDLSEQDEIALLKEIAKHGHTIALHSYTHNYSKIYNSVEDYLEDSYTLSKLIQQTTGVTPTIFRCPGGSLNCFNQKTYRQILREMSRRGFVAYDWNVSAEDSAGNRSKEEIVQTVLKQIQSRRQRNSNTIVLMHDTVKTQTTLDALPAIIHELKNKGYRFAAISKDTRPVLFKYSKKTILSMYLIRQKNGKRP